MRRQDLEHIIRAAAAVTNSNEIMVVGSQSILGSFPDAPAELLRSQAADVYPVLAPELSEVIEGSLGADSPFARQFGYFADGVGPETAALPAGWESRLVRVQGPGTEGKVGYCLEPHDLAASKAIAGREKDRDFVAAMLRHELVVGEVVLARLATVPVEPPVRENARLWLRAEIERQRSP